ncbi:MAG: hypothetical protein ACR2QK_00905 [Acidimicrobiales bacterium]
MTTLLTALFYLWLVTTILLVAMWLLRRQDRRRGPQDQGYDEPIDDALAARDAAEEAAEEAEAEARAEVDADSGSEPEPTNEASAEDTGEAEDTDDAGQGEEATILDLLDGATLPYDMAPTTGCVADPGRHAIFLSPHEDAEAVGTAFADELVNLGYSIEPDGLDQAKAVRDDQTLFLKISPDAGAEGSGDGRYPAAGEHDVAIEVWTGRDSPPPLA